MRKQRICYMITGMCCLCCDCRITRDAPHQTGADGNCLYRAASLQLYGSEEHHCYLRILTALEILENRTAYDGDLHSPNLFELADTVTSRVSYEHLVKTVTTNGSYSELAHMYALSAAVSLPLQSYCPPSESPDCPHQYTLTIRGRNVLGDLTLGFEPLSMMWTTMMVPSSRSAFRNANHIVYLARCTLKNESSESSSLECQLDRLLLSDQCRSALSAL